MQGSSQCADETYAESIVRAAVAARVVSVRAAPTGTKSAVFHNGKSIHYISAKVNERYAVGNKTHTAKRLDIKAGLY